MVGAGPAVDATGSALFLVARSRAGECEAAAGAVGLRPMVAATTEEAMRMLPTFDLRAVVCALGTELDFL